MILFKLDASHLFSANVTKIGFRRGMFLRCYMYDFIELFAPHLNRDRVRLVERLQTGEEIMSLFELADLPVL